ncbi:hypothetical protein GX50_00804 [[Emmonsia] crescens]|uniref:Uncharacterized protein n=1 Tax=[Emmonsia] crescens TaxID=73230 RepID=A0A2B7ZSY6_9EURO|nr:hypothetical protein GX50_00804 [Emmonsia crescens]
MHFISKLSVAVAVTAAAFTEAQPLKKFGYRDYSVRPNDGNVATAGQYPAGPPPAMTILPVSTGVDPIEGPSSSPTSASDVTPSYGPPLVTGGFSASIPADYSIPASDAATSYGPPSVTGGFSTSIPADYSIPASDAVTSYGPPSVTGGFSTSIPADYSIPASDAASSYGPPSITAGFPTIIPTDYSTPAGSETGPRTVTVRPLPVSSGSGVDPIQTLPPTSATYGPPLITGGFPTRFPADPSNPITSQTVTVTYTLGTGVETTVITKTVTLGGPPPPQYPTPPPDAGVDPVSDSTTTLSTTSTTTTTITIQPLPTAPGNGRPNRPSRPNRPGRPGGSPCKPAAVVTVTEKETVTVTVTPAAVDPTFDNPSPTEPVTPPSYSATPDDVTSALPATSSVNVPIKVPRPPYPTGTTANARPTASSGFFTRVLPMPTGGYHY